ncbi:MAG: hypothetical protein ACRCYQ_15745 [Nocardioides sp.]
MITELHDDKTAGSVSRATPSPLAPAVLGAAIGGYLIPAVSTAVNALFIPTTEMADRLAVAAWTTIGVPSATAAVLATIWFHLCPAPTSPSALVTLRAFLVAALLGAVPAGILTVILIGAGVLETADLQFTISAAAIGAGMTARRWARTNRRRRWSASDIRTERSRS